MQRGISNMKKILLVAGDFSEDYEVMVPYQALSMLGFQVDVVCPNKIQGQLIKTAIHDFEGDQTYTEKQGHFFRLTASFNTIDLTSYVGFYLSGGRSSEYLRLNEDVLRLVRYAIDRSLPIAAICHGPQILVAANVLKGRKITAYSTVKPEIELAGGIFVDVGIAGCVVDSNLVSAATWEAHPTILKEFIRLLGVNISY